MFVVTALGNGIMWQCNMESNMRKLILNILAVAVTAMTIFSCNDVRNGEVYRLLTDVDSYIEARPDSALAVLEGIDVEDLGSREEKAKYALLMSMALDKNYVDRTDFEVLQPAIDYYENHGSATDKLRTFYYQGRIYQNQGNDESALACMLKSMEQGEGADDIVTRARNLYTQGYIYSTLYNWDKVIETSLIAADIYLQSGRIDNYLNCITRIINSYALKNDYDKAAEYITICNEYLPIADNSTKSYFYSTCLVCLSDKNDKQFVSDLLDKYFETVPERQVDGLGIARAYSAIEEYDKALRTLLEMSTSEYQNREVQYYAALAQIYENKRMPEDALCAYKKYIEVSDSLDLIIFEQDTKFVEERHNLEVQTYKEREAKNNRTIIILICIIALLVALIAIYLIRKQLQIRTAEKKQLEIEKQRYEQLYADAVAERDALTKMVEDSNVKDETKAVIRERLEILNKVIISHITDTSSANKKAYQELEALVADRESFIESTRLTIEGNNPEFIAALKKQGLTDEEINICCLYVIGLKGKDIKSYTSQPRHYNQSADIRHKLGLTENDTNLSIYLRELLEK